MSMTDPIADMLTRIRNANRLRREFVDIPASKVKEGIARVLKGEGYVRAYKVEDDGLQGVLRVYLKYGPEHELVLNHIKRESKPSRRVYKGVDELPSVLDGLGIAIVSTCKGIKSDRECRAERLGGELLCSIW